jgi:pimeloyl-ACP methyl ester carboxylesterase
VAYALAGRGPALVVVAGWIGHLELTWQDPAYRGFAMALAAHRTVVQYDPAGCGLSDPMDGDRDLDTDLAVLGAVVDAVGVERFDLLGFSTGVPVAVAFAAACADRVQRLVLYGGYADGREVASEDVRGALLRPGARLLLLEHVAAPPGDYHRAVQRAIRRPWHWFFEGCDPCRDTESTLRRAGFAEVDVDHYTVRGPLIPIGCQIAGYAVA